MSRESLLEKLGPEAFEKHAKPVNVENLSQIRRKELIRVGRTVVTDRSRCPCGSGKRFKSCCKAKGE